MRVIELAGASTRFTAIFLNLGVRLKSLSLPCLLPRRGLMHASRCSKPFFTSYCPITFFLSSTFVGR
jgi:hypothetical protein